MKCTTLEIIPEKLRNEIYNRNLTLKTASEELGYYKGFLSKSLGKKKINKTATILLDKLFNIKPEKYLAVIEKEDKEDEVNENKIYDIVYKAVIDALNTF